MRNSCELQLPTPQVPEKLGITYPLQREAYFLNSILFTCVNGLLHAGVLWVTSGKRRCACDTPSLPGDRLLRVISYEIPSSVEDFIVELDISLSEVSSFEYMGTWVQLRRSKGSAVAPPSSESSESSNINSSQSSGKSALGALWIMFSFYCDLSGATPW